MDHEFSFFLEIFSNFPCAIDFAKFVDYLVEPQDVGNFSQFSIQYLTKEEKYIPSNTLKPRLVGHQTWKKGKGPSMRPIKLFAVASVKDWKDMEALVLTCMKRISNTWAVAKGW